MQASCLMIEQQRELSIPAAVAEAMEKDFGMPITAFLFAAVDSPPVLMGTIYGDSMGRFREGASMRTSRITTVVFVEGYSLFETVAGSRYVVISWAPGGHNVYMNRIYH
jgi:hypothetical protein